MGLFMICGTLSAERYDVVVAGAGSGGVSAAIQAARMGMKVALLEETEYIGGQMGSAGVSNMDEGHRLTPPSGFYKEFLANMQAYYDARHQSIATCYWNTESHCFEPIAVKRVLTAMIDDTNRTSVNGGHITLLLRERVTSVESKGKVVTGVKTLHHGELECSILIDATEWGDVIPLSPAAYRSGNQIGKPKHASCTQDITYTMVIKKYPKGVPAELQMKNPPPEYDKYVAIWRLNLQKNGNPDNRWLPVNFAQHNAYRGMPDPGSTNYVSTQPREITKTSINWFNDYPVDTDIFDREKRQKFVCEAKLKTLGNLYYIQHELGETEWSVADDQGYDTPYQREENLCPNIPAEFKAIERNMPQAAYVRESQRIIGKHQLVGSEIRREYQGAVAIKRFPSAIAVGDYADDLHHCSDAQDFETDLDTKADDPPGFRSGPFEVPFGVLIPKDVDGLLAAEKNISVSRLANGAIRLQPITMLTGEAAGALAALSIKEGIPPREVDWERLQVVLLEAGSILASPPISDIPQGTMPWQAAQFAVTHEWMEPDKDGKFHPDKPLDRAEAAEILAAAYDLAPTVGTFGPTPKRLASTFEDVPLYSPISAPVEALREMATAPFCKGDEKHFCPKDVMTKAEFIRIAQLLEVKRKHPMPSEVLWGNMRHDGDGPITRGEAAMVLYAAVRNSAQTH
jgi:hypothetical protein